jgi:adenylate cyclase
VRQNLPPDDAGRQLETEIPFPGLTQPRSQLAVPILLAEDLLGVWYVESPKDLQFTYEHEDILAILASQLALAVGRSEGPIVS